MIGREINRSDFIKKFLTLNFMKNQLVGVMLFHVERQRQQLCSTIANTPKTVVKEIIKV